MRDQERLVAIALAMQLRDSSDRLNDDAFRELVFELSKYELLSMRQIAMLSDNRISHSTLSRWIKKSSRNGGKLNKAHLEKLRDLILQRGLGEVDWHRVGTMVKEGTSPDIISRFTGIPRSTIYRKA